MDDGIELIFDPLTARFDVTGDRWLDQVSVLVADLRAEVDGVHLRSKPTPGTKGALDEIVIPVLSQLGRQTIGGSTDVVSAALGVVAAWLRLDGSRSVRIRLAANGSVQDFEMSGADLDDGTVDELVTSVTARLEGPR